MVQRMKMASVTDKEHQVFKFEHWFEAKGVWGGDSNYKSILECYLTKSAMKLLKDGVFGKFMELEKFDISWNLIHCLLLSQIDSDDSTLMKFTLFDRICSLTLESFQLITGLSSSAGDFTVVSTLPNRLLSRYFPNTHSITLSRLQSFFITNPSICGTSFLDGDSDAVKLAELYIVERVLLGRSENCVVSNYLMKIIDSDELRYSYPWGTLGFNWLVGSLRNSLQLVKEESNKEFSYRLCGFPFALNVWALEVFPVFQEFAKAKPRTFPRMLCWCNLSQPTYTTLVENYFHAFSQFESFKVEPFVATDEERERLPVDLVFSNNGASTSKLGRIPGNLVDIIVESVTTSLQKYLDTNLNAVVKRITSLEKKSDYVVEVLQMLNKPFDGLGVNMKESKRIEGVDKMIEQNVGIIGDIDVEGAQGDQGHNEEVLFETSSQILAKIKSGEIDFSTPPSLAEILYKKEAMDSEPTDLQPLEDVEVIINQTKVPDKIDDLLARKRKKFEATPDFHCPSFSLLSESTPECVDTTGNDEFCTAEEIGKS